MAPIQFLRSKRSEVRYVVISPLFRLAGSFRSRPAFVCFYGHYVYCSKPFRSSTATHFAISKETPSVPAIRVDRKPTFLDRFPEARSFIEVRSTSR